MTKNLVPFALNQFLCSTSKTQVLGWVLNPSLVILYGQAAVKKITMSKGGEVILIFGE